MTTDIEKATDYYTDVVLQMCDEKYLIVNYSPIIPSVVVHSYNKVFLYASSFTGWNEKDGTKPGRPEIHDKIRIALHLFEKARNSLIENGSSEDSVNSFSPVLVLETLLQSTENYKIVSLAHSHIYGMLSIIELFNFRELAKGLIDSYNTDISPSDIERLVTAQSRLIVAQDALNKAYEIMYRVRAEVRENFNSVEIDEILLKLEKNREDKIIAAKKSKTPPPEGLDNALDSTFNKIISLDGDRQLSVIHVAKIIKAHVFNNAKSLNLHWKGKNHRGLQWFQEQIRKHPNKPEYLSGKLGKTEHGIEKAIEHICRELGVDKANIDRDP